MAGGLVYSGLSVLADLMEESQGTYPSIKEVPVYSNPEFVDLFFRILYTQKLYYEWLYATGEMSDEEYSIFGKERERYSGSKPEIKLDGFLSPTWLPRAQAPLNFTVVKTLDNKLLEIPLDFQAVEPPPSNPFFDETFRRNYLNPENIRKNVYLDGRMTDLHMITFSDYDYQESPEQEQHKLQPIDRNSLKMGLDIPNPKPKSKAVEVLKSNWVFIGLLAFLFLFKK